MTDLYNSVFALLKTALFDIDLKVNSNVVWNEIFAELETQCVSAVPADQTDLLDLTEAEQQQYFASVVHTITYWHTVMYEQQEILELLQEAGIPAAVLKGSAAAVYYPKPDYRTMGDIDLIV